MKIKEIPTIDPMNSVQRNSFIPKKKHHEFPFEPCRNRMNVVCVVNDVNMVESKRNNIVNKTMIDLFFSSRSTILLRSILFAFE